MPTPANDTDQILRSQCCEVVYDELMLRQAGMSGIIDLSIDSLKGMAETGVNYLVLIIRPKD